MSPWREGAPIGRLVVGAAGAARGRFAAGPGSVYCAAGRAGKDMRVVQSGPLGRPSRHRGKDGGSGHGDWDL